MGMIMPHANVCLDRLWKGGNLPFLRRFRNSHSDTSILKSAKSVVAALLKFKSLIVTGSTVVDEFVVSRNTSQVDQRLARFAWNVVAHVPRCGFRYQRLVGKRPDVLGPRVFTSGCRIHCVNIALAHVFEQRYNPLALQLGTRWSVAERRWRLRAICEEPALRQLACNSLFG